MNILQAKSNLWNEIKETKGIESIRVSIHKARNVIVIKVSEEGLDLPEEYEGHKVMIEKITPIQFL